MSERSPEVIIVHTVFCYKASSVITRCPLIPVFTLATPQTLSVTGEIICPEEAVQSI